jgi:hypothetical protein
MYEIKRNGKVFTSKSFGTGPSSYEKKNLPGRGLAKLRNTDRKLMHKWEYNIKTHVKEIS